MKIIVKNSDNICAEIPDDQLKLWEKNGYKKVGVIADKSPGVVIRKTLDAKDKKVKRKK